NVSPQNSQWSWSQWGLFFLSEYFLRQMSTPDRCFSCPCKRQSSGCIFIFSFQLFILSCPSSWSLGFAYNISISDTSDPFIADIFLMDSVPLIYVVLSYHL